jgi:hypothetical protein
MAYTRKNIKNLTGGVSQQPDSERFDNQCTAQTNFSADPIKGLTKRAGTNYVQIIEGGGLAALDHPSKNTFTHVINRSSGEQLMLVIGYEAPGADITPDIMLLKLNEDDNSLEQQVLQNSAGATLSDSDLNYLDVSNSHDTHPYSAVTIADYTFIANKDQTPALKATTSGGLGMYERDHVKRGLIFIKESAYGAEFMIKATDSEGNRRDIKITTGVGTGSSKNDIRTDAVAGALHACLESSATGRHDRLFTIDNEGDYTADNTGIKMTFSDKDIGIDLLGALTHLWNGTGYSGIVDGSNYDHGEIRFKKQPNAGDNITITGCDASNTARTFEFGGTGSNVNVAIGTASGDAGILETMENLQAAINNLTSTIAFEAHLTFHEAAFDEHHGHTVPQQFNVDIVSTREGTLSGAAGGNLVDNSSASARYVIRFAGAHASSSFLSQAPARHRIYFDRLPVTKYDDAAASGEATFRTAGSVIAWYASYPTKAAADASPINFEVSDSFGDTMVQTFTDKTDRISTLPSNAPNNYLIKVEGDIENDADDHYIKFRHDNDIATTNQFGGGKWKEDMKGGLQYQIDETTMPHQLIKVSPTTYKFVAADWSDKTVGDANSDAAPSFIGNPINDLFFYKSRLGMLAGESVILSAVDDAYNFWNTSVINSVDSDRIDISSSVNEITYLNWAIPFANQLVIFSDRAQFLLTQGNQGLTPSTAALSLGSSYENSTIARPVVNDNTIIFAQEKSGASAVYEMYPTGSTEFSFEATNISEHIPSYISGKIVNIRASSLASTVVVQTDSGDNTLYIYKYYNSGQKRVQSAWSKYELASDYIKGGHFISDKFHVIEGHHMGSATTVSSCYWILTYMKFDNTDSLTNAVDLYYNVPQDDIVDDGDTSVITLDNNFPLRDNTPRTQKLVVFNKSTNEEYKAATTQESDKWKITVKSGELGGSTDVVVGLKYTASYEFSKQYIKRSSADGKEVAVTDGRTTNKWVEVFFNDTQHLTTTVSFPTESDFRSDSVKTFTGNPDDTITGVRTGEQPSETESLRTSVAARNDLPVITLSSDTHQTVTITGAAFELMHTSRASRTS